jgi:hypothetical protein
MKRIIVSVVIMGLALISCDLRPDDPPQLSNEEHAVISAVLDSLRRHDDPTGTLDVYDQTSISTSIYSLSIAFDRDSVGSASLLNNYNTANLEIHTLDMDKLPVYVMLKDSEESDPYSGYIRFTRPGISNDGLSAVVEYSSISAPLAGSGMAAVLEKQDGVWVLIWLQMMWVS